MAKQALILCLGALKPDMYYIVNARTREDFSYEEIAAYLGIKNAAVRKRFERAVKLLLKCLKNKGYSMADFV